MALILHTLHLPPDCHSDLLRAHLTLAECEKLEKLIHERSHKRVPLPYLTHEAWFAGLSFYVDERVLVPRSPIAELIHDQFAPWFHLAEGAHVLDLCTGSACIAIAIAKNYPASHVDATDISDEALAVAKINLLRHGLEDQITLYQSDLFNQIPHKPYDLIISNPPYVDQEDMASLPKEFLHEPKAGLSGGQDGLDLVARILTDARAYLKPEGALIVEVGNSENALIEKYPDLPFTWVEFQKGGGGVFILTAAQLKALS